MSNKTKGLIHPKEMIEFIDSKLKSNVVPLDAERDAIYMIENYALQCQETLNARIVELEAKLSDYDVIVNNELYYRKRCDEQAIRANEINTIERNAKKVLRTKIDELEAKIKESNYKLETLEISNRIIIKDLHSQIESLTNLAVMDVSCKEDEYCKCLDSIINDRGDSCERCHKNI